jgi:glycosyltransferase involved in cell wall biosynthesis
VSWKVGIVLATYNGAAHVDEQVRSVQAQDFSDWRLFARDDGSTDDTRARLAKLASEDPRITVLEAGERLGVVGNFAALLTHARRAGAKYVFPCDQDDVWLPAKVSRSLAVMERLEAEHGRETPLLVHSDLAVVDEALRPLYPSFLRRQGIGHEAVDPLNVLLVQNFVTGCASLLNGALLDLALPLPERCIMHDWWIAQCAAAAGAIGFMSEATILYRQHGTNQIGSTGAFGNLNVLDAAGRERFVRSWKVGVQSVEQAGTLLERLRERGGAAERVFDLLGAYARISGEPPLQRIRTLRRHHIRRQRPFGTMALYVRTALLGVAAGGADATR